ncbi:MAG: Gfo/Idh/MocA family oxidoreductase [Chloroflexota bacterium]
MLNNVRVGIIGTSWWTEVMFLPSLNSHPNAEIVAICGRNRARGELLAQQYGIAEVYSDYQAMIQQAPLDAVVVASPDDLHFPMTMAALEAGLHVLCEKPLALTVAHAQQMSNKAEAAGVKHMVLFTWRWQPHFRYMKQLVDEGFIGRCYHANLRFLGGFGLQSEYAWRYDGQRSNGVVSDLGAHMIDFAHWLIGDITKVSAQLSTLVAHQSGNDQPLVPTNDAANLILEFGNQAQGLVQLSTVAHQGNRLMEIAVELYGENGRLEAKQFLEGPEAGAELRGARRDEETIRHLEIPPIFLENIDEADLFAPYTKQSAGPRFFIDAILEDRQPTPTFAAGLKVQKVIDAALRAHEQGCWVHVDPSAATSS